MRIGLDMDEVLAQFLASFIAHHNKEYNTNHRLEDINDYGLWKVWGGTVQELSERIGKFFLSDDIHNIMPVNMAQEIIRELKKDNELYVITARHDTARIQTEKWLEKHYPSTFKGIHFSNDSLKTNSSGKSKAELCKDLNIDVMIEDLLSFAKQISKANIPVILIDYPWNKSEAMKKVFRVGGWKEIPDVLLTLKK